MHFKKKNTNIIYLKRFVWPFAFVDWMSLRAFSFFSWINCIRAFLVWIFLKQKNLRTLAEYSESGILPDRCSISSKLLTVVSTTTV